MKRRDFINTALCLGCAGALGTIIPTIKKEGITNLSDIKFLLAKRDFLYKSEDELPQKIRLDICNLCQLNCAACWVRKYEHLVKERGPGFGYVSFDTFKKFIDKHSFIKEIELSHMGEIFLNPDLDKIIEYAYHKNIKLTAYTGVNLNDISEKTAEALVKYKVQGMNVSIDGATPETYAIYRRGGDLNKVIKNIKMINKFKEKYNSEYPHLVFKFITFGHNEHEIEKAKVLAKKLNMDIAFDLNNVKDYSPLKDPRRVKELTGLDYHSDGENDCAEVFLRNPTDDGWFVCRDLFKAPVISYNGDLLGCSWNMYSNYYHINVFKEGLLNALNNAKILYAKSMLTNYNMQPFKEIPCSNCYVYNLLKQKQIKIKYM